MLLLALGAVSFAEGAGEPGGGGVDGLATFGAGDIGGAGAEAVFVGGSLGLVEAVYGDG